MIEASACQTMLNSLYPFHLVLDGDGKIISAGPTAQKIGAERLVGCKFFDLFTVKRPRQAETLGGLRNCPDGKLSLKLRGAPFTQLKGVALRGPQPDQTIINLSFGIWVVEAVQEYGLTAADFAATDLTVEMLYLIEAKSAAMDAYGKLSQKLDAARETAENQALTDALTGLLNRRALDRRLAQMVERSDPFTLMHIDLDYFKDVNDTHGHSAGDAVLQYVGEIMTKHVRPGDIVARVGGDEFVIVLIGHCADAEIAKVAARVISRIRKPVDLVEGACSVSCSIGIVKSGDYATVDIDKMQSDADVALYAAKGSGRSGSVFYTPTLRSDPWQRASQS